MKNIHIAVVENEAVFRTQVNCLLKTWEEHAVCGAATEMFEGGEDFLSGDYGKYHIVFMDTELDGKISGIDMAKEIRKRNKKTAIVFLTSYHEYAVIDYPINAMDYIVKPFRYADIERCMNQLMELLSEEAISVKLGDEVRRIRYNDIVYFQSYLHYIDIYTTDSKYTYKSSIKDLLTVLPLQFVQCHRAVIANKNHIQSIYTKELVMTGKYKLPISDTYIQKVRDTFLKENTL